MEGSILNLFSVDDRNKVMSSKKEASHASFKKNRRGRPVPISRVLALQDNSRKVIYCNLSDYIAREPDFISTLCECGVEYCSQLHHNHKQSDFDEN